MTVKAIPGSGAITLSVSGLHKTIGKKEIIKGISFDVRAGEIFGFLGPNGSGKTTTIRMLVGLIKPTSGSVSIGGYDVQKERVKALGQVGCIVENPEMYPYLTGWENLEHFARMMPGLGEERIRACVERVGLEKRIHDQVRTYSLGMRQRLGIAQALLGQPKLMILDEPTNGLDPQGIKEMRQFIRQLADEGMSVFISSHLLSEVQLMCDRVAIISHGNVIQVGEVNALVKQAQTTVVWNVDDAETASNLLNANGDVNVLETVAELDGTYSLKTAMDDAAVATAIRELAAAGVNLYAVQRKQATLEDLFLQLTEGESID